MANEKNLKGPLSPNEAREQGRKGGIASGKARRKKADLRKAMEAALKNNVLLNGEEIPAEAAICVRMINETIAHGSVGAYKAIMDTIGHSKKTVLDELEQEERIKRMKLEAERVKAEIELLKRREEMDSHEMPDDGFLEALKGTASEDWADEG